MQVCRETKIGGRFSCWVFVVSLVVGLLIAGSPVLAATNIWRGGAAAGPTNWDSAENWSTGKAPAAGDGQDISIPGGVTAYPTLEQDAAVGGGLAMAAGSSLSLNSHNLTVAGDLKLAGGSMDVTKATLTVGGSLIAAGAKSVNMRTDKDSTIIFTSSRPATLDTGGSSASPLDGLALQNIVVDKPGGSLLLSNRIVVVNGTLKVKNGRLEPRDGGAVWMGVAQAGGKVLDVALAITSVITPEMTPDVTATAVDAKNRSLVVEHPAIGPALPNTTRLTNIDRFAAIRSVPYTAMVRCLVDPDPNLRTMVMPEQGAPYKGNRYEFHFTQPHSIARIRWANVNGPWALLADTTGNGHYDRLLRMDLQGTLSNPGGVWRGRAWATNNFWPPVKAYGIAIVNPSKTMDIYDFQILCPAGKVAVGTDPKLAPGVAELQGGAVLPLPVPTPAQQFFQGFHIEPWIFNANGWVTMDKARRPPLTEYKPFVDFIAQMKKYHANTLNMWPPKTFGPARGKGTYELDLLWPSQYDKWSISEDALKEIADAFRANGIRLFTMDRVVYPKPLEEFPKTDTRDEPAPYISRASREFLKGFVLEQVKQGVDGVGIGYDEQQGVHVNPANADDVTKQAFRARFGIDPPTGIEDSAAYRRWVLFGYEQFASYLGDAAAAAKAANPKILTESPVHVCLGNLWNRRIDVAIAEDIVGHMADIDFVRAYSYEDNANLYHYIAATMAERMAGANPGKGPGMGSKTLLNAPWADDPNTAPGYFLEDTPESMYGPPLSAIMHGGGLPLYWRYDHINYGGYDKYVEQAYAMLDTMAAWGAKDAQVPGRIVVLKSRASEDWWQVRQRYNPAGNPLDQTRGFLYEKWLMEFLLSRGYPFRTYYLDQPKDFTQDIAKANLIILPFAYSVSDEAVAAIENAVQHGAKLLLFDRQGETDEMGDLRRQPAFTGLVTSGKAVFIGDDMTAIGQYPATQDKTRALVDRLLGNNKPIYFQPYGNDVEFACLERGDREKFLLLNNYTDRNVTVDAGVNMPAGQYQVMQRDLTEVRQAILRGRDAVTAADLAKFRVSLAPWEVKVLYIRPNQ